MVDIICTIGPGSDSEKTLLQMKEKGMNYARINLSHAGLDYVKEKLPLCKELEIPLILDTAGAQVRTGKLKKNIAVLEEGSIVNIHKELDEGDEKNISLWPSEIFENISEGDIVSIDFDSLLLSVFDVDKENNIAKAKVLNGGVMGNNKSVVVSDSYGDKRELPVLSESDKEILEYGINNGIKFVAASFMNSKVDVDYVRSFTGQDTKIISKIESKRALNNLSDILQATDYALIDRGDLSKEAAIERIPLIQKIILKNGAKYDTPIFIATNLLESMSEKKNPTRAEVNDIINSILDGASGLVLAGETATGDYPVECVKVLNKLIKHSHLVVDMGSEELINNKVVKRLEELNYIQGEIGSSLIEPHGGKLVNKIQKEPINEEYISTLFKIPINYENYKDLEQIGIGTFSPLEGFMDKQELTCVLDNMRLPNGVAWPLPILLDIDEGTKNNISVGQEIGLTYENNVVATLKVKDIYSYDKEELNKKCFDTNSEEHPGVEIINNMNNFFVGGEINLLKRRGAKFKRYELNPSQTRKIFEEKGWGKVVGFHTRNVIHKSHEFIQLSALNDNFCDGLFVHPIIGKKKKGDFQSEYIIKSYEIMLDKYYPKGKVIFGTFSSFSRYGGPREAIFTAICRKNFGCSHFIVGRDHTGVKDFYKNKESQKIFDKFPDLGIVPIPFDEVFYSKTHQRYLHTNQNVNEDDKLQISGTEARKMLQNGVRPPSWFMRDEISEMIINSLNDGEKVFVE